MIKIVSIILVLIFFIGLQSCKSTYPILKESYSFSDTLIVKDYFFQRIDGRVNNSPQDEADSIFTIFKSILKKLDVPVVFDTINKNKVDYFFLKENYGLLRKRIDTCLVKDLASLKEKNNLVLIPYLEIWNSALGSEGGYSYSSWANVQVFIVKNNKILYASSTGIRSDVHFEPEYKKIKRNINTKEDWEKAINGAMKEYIERLE